MNIVLLGGNGYIGRNVTEQWLKKDSNANFYVLSRSGKNDLVNSRIKNIKVDVSDINEVKAKIPENVDYIVDFIGGLEGDLEKINTEPARIMCEIAEEKNVKAMGYIGGTLGSKDFVAIKSKVISMLEKSDIRLEVVEPTLVYGNGRSDALAKMVPIFKFLGIFKKNMKPDHVNDVSKELISKLTG